jgi:ABC-type molybdenum transport system ATPase subunit/photorepair protein PhrA
LFGKYSYPDLDFSKGTKGGANVSVLIGDNGSGKTTLLRLVYAALSPEDRSGLRTYLAKTPFNSLIINLADGRRVEIVKPALVGSFSVRLTGTDNVESEFFVKADTEGTVKSEGQQQQIDGLHDALRIIGIDILFIDHARKVRSTYEMLTGIKTNENKLERARRAQYEFITMDEVRERSRLDFVEFPLTEIIGAVHEWFRVGAFRQGTTGEQDASSVYLEVIRTLGRRRKPAPMEPQTREELVHELENLNILTEPFIRHGLLSRYPFGELRDLLASTNRLKIPQIQSVLAPFLTSIRRRVDALNAVQTLISIYEEELNRYFRDKTATFHILEGLKISDRNAPLLPESLSSGERQLVFLMSAAILARAGKSLILIDEPELSLNYKWQRLIASSLARVASDSDTQFVLASHSIEIISRNLDSAVEL